MINHDNENKMKEILADVPAGILDEDTRQELLDRAHERDISAAAAEDGLTGERTYGVMLSCEGRNSTLRMTLPNMRDCARIYAMLTNAGGREFIASALGDGEFGAVTVRAFVDIAQDDDTCIEVVMHERVVTA